MAKKDEEKIMEEAISRQAGMPLSGVKSIASAAKGYIDDARNYFLGGRRQADAAPEAVDVDEPVVNQAAETYTAPKQTMYQSPTYQSKYDGSLQSMAQQYINRDPFSYDPNTDPIYQQYLQQYGNLGKQAMNDVYANQAARTGGLGSSYAVTASQNAYNDYMKQAAAKVPELYQLAYSMYRDQGDDMLTGFNLLKGLDDSDYGRYQDQRDFGRGIYSDERSYNDQQQALAQGRIGDYLAAGGKTADLDANLIEQSGYTPAELAAYEKYYAQLAAKGSGRGGSGSGSGNPKGTYTDDQLDLYNRIKYNLQGHSTAADALNEVYSKTNEYRRIIGDDLTKQLMKDFSWGDPEVEEQEPFDISAAASVAKGFKAEEGWDEESADDAIASVMRSNVPDDQIDAVLDAAGIPSKYRMKYEE